VTAIRALKAAWSRLRGSWRDVADLRDAVDSKAASSHFHDDRYYTETEANALLSDKADLASGKHTAAQSRGSSLSYNVTNGELTLTGADLATSIANLPIELLLQSVSYNSSTKTVTYTTNGGATISIPLTDLVDLPEIQVATQNPVANPTSGQRLYLRSDTGSYWVAASGSWVGPYLNLTIGTSATTAGRGDHTAAAYAHSQSTHAPSNAQKNSDITKAEIAAKLTGDVTTAINWLSPQTFDEMLASVVKVRDSVIAGEGSNHAWPPNRTIVTSQITTISNTSDCSSMGLVTELSCTDFHPECSWVDPAITCDMMVTGIDCAGVPGCNWEPVYCTDLGNETECNDNGCSWDNESGCNGGLVGNVCVGESQTGCSGIINEVESAAIEFAEHFSLGQLGILVNNGDSLSLLNNGEEFGTVPVGHTVVINRVNDELRILMRSETQ
jgi:hypothetical protein